MPLTAVAAAAAAADPTGSWLVDVHHEGSALMPEGPWRAHPAKIRQVSTPSAHRGYIVPFHVLIDLTLGHGRGVCRPDVQAHGRLRDSAAGLGAMTRASIVDGHLGQSIADQLCARAVRNPRRRASVLEQRMNARRCKSPPLWSLTDSPARTPFSSRRSVHLLRKTAFPCLLRPSNADAGDA